MIAGGSRCALADGECRGRLEWHHAVSQSRLKRQFRYGAWRHIPGGTWKPTPRPGIRSVHEVEQTSLDAILGDPRNRVWACSFHHEKITNHRIEAPLPESVWEFAAEFGLTAQLENDLARRSAPAVFPGGGGSGRRHRGRAVSTPLNQDQSASGGRGATDG